MKRNKLILQGLTIAVFSLLIAQISFAQQDSKPNKREQHKEKIKTHKIAYLTNKLDLTPEEAEKFWPVYNEHEAIMEKERKEFREQNKTKSESESIPDLSDAEAKEVLNARLNHEQKALNLRTDFYDQLNDILSPKKILMLMEAEKEFRVDLMRRLSGPRDGSRGPHQEQRKN